MAGAAGAILTRRAHAQSAYPSRPVRVVVSWPPGGGADTVSRILFQALGERWGTTFVIENRAGAAGTIGAASVARVEPDGYTVLYDSTGQSIHPSLMPNMTYDIRKDFVPVALTALVPNLLVVNPSAKPRSVAELIALAKATPGGLDFASSGTGSVQHMALELLKQTAGISLNHVPYRGGGPALNDVVAGHISYYFSNASASTGMVQSGQVIAIAHSGTGRIQAFPDLPSVADTLPGYAAYEWNGVFAPAATPQAIVAKLNEGLNEVMTDPAVNQRLASLNVAVRRNSPEEFRQFFEGEVTKWARVIREGNIQPTG
jgi:tripartite-type tricarboxylate transporter receptor subunit TctC